MEFDDPTQCTQNTQDVVDPRRMGRNNSGLCEADISDIICILHPCSPAAFRVVMSTAELTPHNVLQNAGFENYEDGLTQSELEEQETFILNSDAPYQALDLALRFSTRTKDPKLGFVFGRNASMCDIVLATDSFKRVSNVHFSVFINSSGVLMLKDMSTNGTLVDDVTLKGKTSREPQTRMLSPASIIQILSPRSDEIVKFIVRIPSREGHTEEYKAKFQAYMHNAEFAEGVRVNNLVPRRLATGGTRTQAGSSISAPLVQNQYGMQWSGGNKYNVVGLIGKGAFATVYQLATKSEGQLFAAKELEKRRFMKNNILDQKLDNEMHIMRSVSHKNIVQYIDYQDHANHLYIIMEFVPCGDLQQYLKNNGPLHENLAKQMAAQVLDALAYLHRKKITHRDIKPDNILIANADPEDFTVKLSDFGLSKVVKDNETFLKTFCGTLLYCAPEVFPMYDAHVAGKGKKRPRKSTTMQPSRFHSYSQSVDIWSFGAVLWYSLCFKPPFEGVADKDGRGMFDKIMMTPLDATDLIEHGVPEDAVALLVEMLNTDPAARPSPAACLHHRWFGFQQSTTANTGLGPTEEDLHPIAEEEEEADVEEPDVSGLSLDEQESGHGSQTSEVSIHSGSLEFLDPRQSKRFKSGIHAYRDQEQIVNSSPEIFYQSIPIIHQPETGQAATSHAPGPRMLFGEIPQPALESSGVLGRRFANLASTDHLDWREAGGDTEQGTTEAQEDSFRASPGPPLPQHAVMASPSLLGAESMVRELNMSSSNSANSQEANSNEPITPKMPGVFEHGSHAAGPSNAEDDTTPRQPQPSTFSRLINLPVPPSFYYEANDPSTHNLEYASKKSGIDYVSTASNLAPPADIPPPPTKSGSATEDEAESDLHGEQPNHSLPPSQFVKPPPRLGKLVSTPDSIIPITLNLTSRASTWGRAPDNTHQYPDAYDIRIPKHGFLIWFYGKDIDKIPEDDQEWLKMPDLRCLISTESSQGLYINGIALKKGKPGRKNYGWIYTGDEIVVYQGSPDGKAGLKFTCEFYHGEGKNKRPDTAPRFHIETGGSQPKHRGHEKEKENVPAAESATSVNA